MALGVADLAYVLDVGAGLALRAGRASWPQPTRCSGCYLGHGADGDRGGRRRRRRRPDALPGGRES